MTTAADTTSEPRSRHLKSLTREVHEHLDNSIMSMATFASLEGYVPFLKVQYLFHLAVDPLYREEGLKALLPDLLARRRLPLAAADLADLAIDRPEAGPPVFAPGARVDVPTALGWCYVAEGSTMGAALLRKEAAKLGLSDDFGARHLAPAPEGPAPHWRAFVAALDAVELDAEEEDRVTQGAVAAFAHVQALVDAAQA